MTDERLLSLVESIQQLNATEYEEMFKLLYQNKCEYTRNNNGIFLNLSWLDKTLLEKLELFVEFCKASRREIQHYESICKNLSQNIQDKYTHTSSISALQEKGIVVSPGTAVTATAADADADTETIKKSYMSSLAILKNTSAMKFYLLKKKYAKNSVFDQNIQNDLEKEAVLL